MWVNVNYQDPLTLNLYTYCWNNPLQFIDPSGYWPDWNKLAQGALLATAGVLTVAAVIATGGAATPLIAAGYAAVAVSGGVLAVQGASEVVESFTGENYVKNAIGENTYYTVQDICLAVATVGLTIIDGIETFNIKCATYSNTTEKTVKLFRVMSDSEYESIINNGGMFSSIDNAMDAKWFATDINNAVEWGNKLYTNSEWRIMSIEIPESFLSQFYFHEHLDGIGVAYCIDLELLNEILKGINYGG